jgi:hypothetical protein
VICSCIILYGLGFFKKREPWIVFEQTKRHFKSITDNVDTSTPYMCELIQATSKERPIHLNAEQAFKFLFGKQGKRANLFTFWNEMSQVDESIHSSNVKSINSLA